MGQMPKKGHGLDGHLATQRGEAAWFTFLVFAYLLALKIKNQSLQSGYSPNN
jgi:hypothetical protein